MWATSGNGLNLVGKRDERPGFGGLTTPQSVGEKTGRREGGDTVRWTRNRLNKGHCLVLGLPGTDREVVDDEVEMACLDIYF